MSELDFTSPETVKNMLEIIDERVQLKMSELKNSKNYSATVTSVGVGVVSVQLQGANNVIPNVLNKSGQPLAVGNQVILEAINGSMSNLVVKFKKGKDMFTNGNATGDYSFVGGRNTLATNTTSMAIGNNTYSHGYASFSAGEWSIGTGTYAFALGRLAFVGYFEVITSVNATTREVLLPTSSHSFVVGDQLMWNGTNLGNVQSVSGATIVLSNVANLSNNMPVMLISRNNGFSGYASNAQNDSTLVSGWYSYAMGQSTRSIHSGAVIMGRNGATTDDYAWHLGNGTSPTSLGLAAKILSSGQMYADGAYNSTGADYAELFEWEDGNMDDEDRVGYFVTLEGNKIRKATSSDSYLLGIVSANPSIIGDVSGLRWNQKYMTDNWGRIQYHYVTIPAVIESVEVDGESIEKTILPEHLEWQPILNPEWNPNEPYVERIVRPEWDAIGLMGKLLCRDDGTCEVNGYCSPNDEGIATSDTTGYRVMRRVSENIIEVFIK